ncbi:hypothetical protein HZC33_03210 [Candidatus Wolfebacteria bacterium]|nr:hypothetical protein [Candidatus Wolfebacteria bacterium]
MNKRLTKQLIYGSGFLATFFLFTLFFYFIFLKSPATCFDNKQNQNETGIDCGGVCVSCELKNLSPLEIGFIKYFSVNNKAVITAQIKNSNQNYGVGSFSYILEIYDKNKNKIKNIERNSFIYNLDVKYVIEITDLDYAAIGGVNLVFSNILWKQKDEFKKPKITLREKITKPSESGKGIEISGIVVNESPFALAKAIIISFLNNNNGIKISASKTEIENLEPFGVKSFKIFFPVDVMLFSPQTSLFNVPLADPNKTEIYIDAK